MTQTKTSPLFLLLFASVDLCFAFTMAGLELHDAIGDEHDNSLDASAISISAQPAAPPEETPPGLPGRFSIGTPPPGQLPREDSPPSGPHRTPAAPTPRSRSVPPAALEDSIGHRLLARLTGTSPVRTKRKYNDNNKHYELY